jgi:N utilization substance protein A
MAENMFSELTRIIEQVGKDKGIDKQLVVDAVIQGMLVAARKKWGTYRDIEAQFNDDSGEVELYEFKEVVKDEDFVDEEVEIKLNEALELDPEAQIGDSIGIKLEAGDLGRIAAQTAKQIITQKVRDAERDIIFGEFEQRKGEIASGIARRVERGAIVVDLGRTEAYIPPREQIPGEQYKPGDRLQGYIADVRQTTRGPQIIMSRADERYLVKLFEAEVPEIYDGIVQVVAAAREPGQRAKIAVLSKDPTVDPVGACVGMKGSRVQNIVQELRGEKIDIVPWQDDVTRFVCNALAPAEITKVYMDEVNKSMEVVVADSQLSLAIGRRGQNVRLAAKLTGWKIDILSESSSGQRNAEAIFNLMLLPGMSETMAQSIYQSGFSSVQAIADVEPEDIMVIPGYETEEKASKLLYEARDLIETYKAEGKPLPKMPVKTAGAAMEVQSSGSAKSQAEERLKEQMQQLKKDEDENG